jgi:large subunit ribosomal protein L5e
VRPFTALLDVGLKVKQKKKKRREKITIHWPSFLKKATTTGSKLFAALKGAVDGGLSIPHSPQRFVGYNKEESQLDAAKLRKHIFGGHVAAYMKLLQPNEELYKKRFSKFIAAGVNGDNLEALYKKVHANIRANPEFVSKKKNTPHKKWSRARMSRAQRKVKEEGRRKKKRCLF